MSYLNPDEYLLEEFLRNVSHRVRERCHFCYSIRLEATAREAKDQAFLREIFVNACDYFTTVLAPGSDAAHADHVAVVPVDEAVSKRREEDRRGEQDDEEAGPDEGAPGMEDGLLHGSRPVAVMVTGAGSAGAAGLAVPEIAGCGPLVVGSPAREDLFPVRSAFVRSSFA